MENLNIEQFNPKVAELQALAGKAETVDITDLKAVKEVRLELKNARVEISKTGKDMRENATTFAKAVIAREKELIALIEPQELRLQEAETAEKLRLEREERKAILPVRVARIVAIFGEGHQSGITEEEVLGMDGATFEGLINRLQAEKLDRDRAEIARQQAEIARTQAEQAKEQERLDWEAKSAERAETARLDEVKRADKVLETAHHEKIMKRFSDLYALGLRQNEQGDAYTLDDFFVPVTEIRNQDDGVWALIVSKIVTLQQERKEAAEALEKKILLEANLRYLQWLTEIGYHGNPDDFRLLENSEGNVTAYRAISTYFR